MSIRHLFATAVRGVSGSGALFALVVLLAPAPPLAAQGFGYPGQEQDEAASALRVRLVSLENQPAEEAVKLVMPLLSSQGSVEVQPGGNTVVIRDTLAALARILPILAEFDHPRRVVDVSVWLFRAHHTPFSPSVVTPALPELSAVVETLRRHLRYADYELVGEDHARPREGEVATLDLEQGFRVRFRVGTVLGSQRVRLAGFEVSREPRTGDTASLLRSNLNLWLDRPAVVALTRPPGEGGRDEKALLVVIRTRLPATETPRER